MNITKESYRLTTISFINNTGSNFVWPLNTIYMHNYLHQPLSSAGIVLFINAILTFGGNYFGGYLFDKYQGKISMMIGLLISAISLSILVFFHSWPIYALLLSVLGFGSGITLTVTNSLAAESKIKNKTKLFSTLYVSLNLGVAIGTSISGFIADYNINYIFLANLFFVVLLLFCCPLLIRVNTGTQWNSSVGSSHSSVTSRHLKIGIELIISFYLITWLFYSQWSSNVATYMTSKWLSVTRYSLLWTINALTIVLLLPILNRVNNKIKVILGISFFSLSFLIMMFATSYSYYVFAIIALTIGEMLVFPMIPATVSELTIGNKSGFYQSIVNMAATLGKAVGPYLGALLIEYSCYKSYYAIFSATIMCAVLIYFLGLRLTKNT